MSKVAGAKRRKTRSKTFYYARRTRGRTSRCRIIAETKVVRYLSQPVTALHDSGFSLFGPPPFRYVRNPDRCPTDSFVSPLPVIGGGDTYVHECVLNVFLSPRARVFIFTYERASLGEPIRRRDGFRIPAPSGRFSIVPTRHGRCFRFSYARIRGHARERTFPSRARLSTTSPTDN